MRCRVTITLIPGQKEAILPCDMKPELTRYIIEFLQTREMSEKMDVTFQCNYDGSVFGNTYDMKEVEFTQIVRGVSFTYSIDGFAQVNKTNAEFAHETVIDMLDMCREADRKVSREADRKVSFIGVGGESLLYGVSGDFDKMDIYTNSAGVHRDNLRNAEKVGNKTINCYLVDYDKVIFDVKDHSICVANVSRNGIRADLCKQLDNLFVKDIIAVYCADVYKRDLEYLHNYYVNKIQTNGNLYIVWFKRVHLVSLGNNCSIAYQLQKLGLRGVRYPFDWLRYKKIDQLMDCIEHKFEDFDVVVGTKKPVGEFRILHDVDESELTSESSKEILINKYKMEFPHDKRENMSRYTERIKRMLELKVVDYVIDIVGINDDVICRIKELLPNMRKLIIIPNEKALIHSPDTWKKDHLDWLRILKG